MIPISFRLYHPQLGATSALVINKIFYIVIHKKRIHPLDESTNLIDMINNLF